MENDYVEYYSKEKFHKGWLLSSGSPSVPATAQPNRPTSIVAVVSAGGAVERRNRRQLGGPQLRRPTPYLFHGRRSIRTIQQATTSYPSPLLRPSVLRIGQAVITGIVMQKTSPTQLISGIVLRRLQVSWGIGSGVVKFGPFLSNMSLGVNTTRPSGNDIPPFARRTSDQV